MFTSSLLAGSPIVIARRREAMKRFAHPFQMMFGAVRLGAPRGRVYQHLGSANGSGDRMATNKLAILMASRRIRRYVAGLCSALVIVAFTQPGQGATTDPYSFRSNI